MQQDPSIRGAGRYRLLDLLSLDEFGSVWAAEDSLRRHRVTVRQISRRLVEDPGFVDRLQEMGRGLIRFSHPNVASVLALSAEARGVLYVVMEPMHGQTLAERLRTRGPLPHAEASRIASCLTDALDAAHRAGIEHGPVIPENVMLTTEGEVKLMDFGLASASGASPPTSGAAAPGSSPLPPHPWSPSRDLESIGGLMDRMLPPPSPPDREPERPRSRRVQPSLQVSVFPRELLFDTTPRARDPGPSVARAGRASRERRARAPRAPRRLAARVGRPPKAVALGTGRALKMTVLGTGRTLRIIALGTGRALKMTVIGAGRAVRWTGSLPRRALRVAGRGAGRAGRAVQGHHGPALATVGVAAVAVVIVGGVFALAGSQATEGPSPFRDGGQQTAETPPPTPPSVIGGVEVPNLIGLSAFQAQQRLDGLGLRHGAVVPTTGAPGEVVATAPQPGVEVSRGTEITLFVGARSGRSASTPG